MRVLLDEDINVRLRHHFGRGFEVQTARYRGWTGLKNGDLLKAAEGNFDAFVTMDNSIPYQQNLNTFELSVIRPPLSEFLESFLTVEKWQADAYLKLSVEAIDHMRMRGSGSA